MSEPFEPRPEPSGSRKPPRRNAPTAVGVATPPPPRPTRPSTPIPRQPWLLKALRRGMDSLFDLADTAAEAVRSVVGLQSAPPPKTDVRTLPKEDR